MNRFFNLAHVRSLGPVVLLLVVLCGWGWWGGLDTLESAVGAAMGSGERVRLTGEETAAGTGEGERPAGEQVGAMEMVRTAGASAQFDQLRERAAREGTIPVLVRVRAKFEPERESLGEAAAEAQRASIQAAQEAVLAGLFGYEPTSLKRYVYLPFLGMRVNEAGIESLRASADVTDIQEDRTVRPVAVRGLAEVEEEQVGRSGTLTGEGSTIAILDTGIDRSDAMLSQKVVAEGCFSTNDPNRSVQSLCPAGKESVVEPESGRACTIEGAGCEHGTGVAKVAVGRTGIARGASLISLQVFSRLDNAAACPDGKGSCLIAYDSDILAAMEHVYRLRHEHRIAAVNLSLGGGIHPVNCDAAAPAMTAAIDLLRSAGIATVVASGDDSSGQSLSRPACLSGAISVGATVPTSLSLGNPAAVEDELGRERGSVERVAPTSNSAPALSLLAVGSSPSISDGAIGEEVPFGGTSLAASRVAGALAVLRQKFPAESVDTLLFRLRQTGRSISDPRNNLVHPRIELEAALAMDRLAQAQAAPSAPEGLVAVVVSATQIDLTWNDTTNETGYRVERRTSSTGTWSVLTTLPANQTSFQNLNLTPGRTYFYQVFAINADGQSPPSDEVRATSQPVPLPPTGLTATRDVGTPATRINLTWTDNATNEQGYRVYRALNSGGPYTVIQTTVPDTTSYSDTGLLPNTTYHYRITAFSGGAESSPSDAQGQTDQAIPAAPTGLTTTATSTSQIDLAWTDNSPNENAFQVLRALANPDGTAGSFVEVALLPANTTSYLSTGLTKNTKYFYRVLARNSEGDSAFIEGSATTLDTPPVAPSGLTATATSATSVALSWTDNSDNETHFRIERRLTDPGEDWIVVDNLASLTTGTVGSTVSYTDATAAQAKTYQYRVSATNSGGQVSSAPAGPVTATTPPLAPATPTDLTAVGVSTTSILVEWVDSSTNEASFQLEQREGMAGAWVAAATISSTTVTLTGTKYASTVTGLAENRLYEFRVFARNSGGDSTPIGPVSATTLLSPPAAPSGLLAVNRSDSQLIPPAYQIELTWTDNSETETDFLIRRSTTVGGPYTQVGTVGANVTRFVDTGLTADTTYYYVVLATNTEGSSAPSNEASARVQTTPARPTSLQVSDVEGRRVTLSWTDNSGVEEGFRVYRKIGAGEFTLLTSLPASTVPAPSVVTYLVSNLKPSTSYAFQVTSFRTSPGQFEGESQPSNEVAVTTLAEPPVDPTEVQASVISPTRIDLTWNYDPEELTNVDSFRVSRKSGAGAYTVLTTPDLAVSVRSFSDTTAQDGTQYTYLLQAVNTTAPSVGIEVSQTTPLPAPSGLTATQTSRDIIQLTWTRNSTNETSFVVERSPNPTGPFTEQTNRPAGATTATDAFDETDVVRDQLYYYRVKARNAQTTSAPSPAASAMWLSIPLTPTNLSARPVTTNDPASQITLSWVDNATNEARFKVERKTDSTDYVLVTDTVPPNSESYLDTNLGEGTRYTYRVSSSNISGDSPTPPTVSIYTRAAAPSGLQVTATAPATLALSWVDNSSRETAFSVRRSTTEAGPYSELASLPANTTSYIDQGLNPGTTYFYRVFAINAGGVSAPTATISGLSPSAPAPPTGLTAIPRVGTTTEIDLSWVDNSTNETSFKIERRPGAGGAWTLIATLPSATSAETGSTLSYHNTGLMEGQGYTYRVIAANVGGDSLPSGEVTATTLINTPAAPSGLTAVNRSDTQATPANLQIELTWTDNSATETGFIIDRSTISGGPYLRIATVGANVTRYTDATVSLGITYYYVVRATNAEGDSALSNEASGTAQTSPSKPTLLNASNIGPNSVRLTWQDNSGVEEGFRIYRQIVGGNGGFTLIDTVAAQTTSAPSPVTHEITGLLAGVTYQFEVTAFQTSGTFIGESQPTNTVEVTTLPAPPAAPSGLTRTVVSFSQIDLSWTDNSHNEDGFIVLRSTTTGTGYESVGAVPANGTSFSDMGLSPETTYYYVVQATNGEGDSALSAEVSGTTPAAPPAAPTGLVFDIISSFQLNLGWTDNATNETGYRLQRKVGLGSWEPAIILSPDTTSFQDFGLEEGETYHYRIWAVNANGESGVVEGNITMPTLPAAPSGLTVSATSATSLTLTWIDNATNETGFRIYRRVGTNGDFSLLTTAPAHASGPTATYVDTGLDEATSYSYRISSINPGGESDLSGIGSATTLTRPAAPVLLPLTVLGSTSIQVDWTYQASGQTGFRVERASVSGGPATTVATVGAEIRTVTDTGLNAKQVYYYRVIATNATDESLPSNEAFAETEDGVPAAPSNLQVTVSSTTSTFLTWTNNATNAANFEIQRQAGEGEFTTLITLPVSSTSYTDSGLTPGTTYVYRVRATNTFGDPPALGTSDWSNVVTVTPPAAPPTAPDNLMAEAISSTSIRLTWADNSTNETGFQIERKAGAGAFEAPVPLPANGTATVTYVDTGLTSGTQYTYRVRAINQAGESTWSAESSAIPPANVPAAPTSLTATTTGQSIQLSWTDNAADETGYRVLRSPTGLPGSFVLLSTLGASATSYLDANLTELTTYYYEVNAFNLAGSSGSVTDNFTTLLGAPTELTATIASFTSVTLTWTDNSLIEDGFLVYRSTTGASGPFTPLLVTINENITTFIDSDLTAGASYSYRVQTRRGITESDSSNTVTVTLPTQPPAPTSLLAVAEQANQVALTWAYSGTNHLGFRIERRSGGATTWDQIAEISNPTARTYLDTTTTGGLFFSYRVRAYNAGGNSDASNDSSVNTPALPPTAPSDLTVEYTGTAVLLRWTDNSDNEIGFRVQRRLAGATNFLTIRGAESLAPNTTSYVDTTAVQGRSYDYRVRAESVLNVVTSAWSNEVSLTLPVLPPLEPSDLSASAPTPFTVTLRWTDNSNNEDGFRILRRVGTFGPLTELVSVGSGIAEYEDTELLPNTTYAYAVQSFNSGGESDPIGPVSVTTPSASVLAPSLLTASTASASQVNLSWRDNSNNETIFRVERRTGAEAIWSFVANVPSTTRLQTGATITYQVTGLTAGVTYLFRVIAINESGTTPQQSAPSNEATATTTPGLPAAPSDVQAQATTATSIQLTWTAVTSNVTGYRIERRVGELGVWGLLIEVPASSISHSDTSLVTGTTYFYRIASVNGTILSAFSAEVSATPVNTGGTAPAAPTNLQATAVSPTQVDLVWLSGTTNLTGFRIERRDGAGSNWATVGTVGASVRIFSDINLTPGVTYTYRVFALNGLVASLNSSNEASATPVSGGVTSPPNVPSGLSVTAASNTSAEVRWSDTSSNESGFRIYRRQGTGTAQEVGTVGLNVTVWTDEGLVANSTYTYWVVAFNIQGESLPSNSESVTIPVSAFTPIENGESITRQIGRSGSQYFRIYVPSGATDLEVEVGGVNQIDVYLLRDRQPTVNTYSCRVLASQRSGSSPFNRFCRIGAPSPGDWHMLARSTSITTDTYSIKASYLGGEIDESVGTPSNLQALVVSNTQIDLSWIDNASGETGYQIQRRVGTGTFEDLALVAGNVTVYQDVDLTPGTLYTYVVAAVFPARVSAFSNQASATTTGTAPIAPSAPTMGVPTSITASGATLNWTPGSNNQTGFQLQRSISGTETWETIATPGQTGTSFVDSGLTSSTTYLYRIAATNAFGTSDFSNVVSVTTLTLPVPSAPTNLTATAVSTSQINLSWTLGGTTQTGFQIERSIGSPTNWVRIDTLIGQFFTSYQSTGLSEGTTYYYRVFAVNSFGPSVASNTANATTQGTPVTPPPTAPSNLMATAVSATQIDLTWTNTSTSQTGLTIQRRIGPADWSTLTTLGATSTRYEDTGLTEQTTYFYRIFATSPGGPSGFSTEASATTPSSGGGGGGGGGDNGGGDGGGGGSTVPAAPTGLIVSATSNSSAEIRWNASAGATEYRIFRWTLGDPTRIQVATTLSTDPTPTRLDDSGLIANVTYFYQVEAVNSVGTSPGSTEGRITIPISAFTIIGNNESVTRSIGRSGQQFFRLYIPEGVSEFVVNLTGSSNVDLLVLVDRQPTANSFNCRAPGSQTGPRICRLTPSSAGDWHILARSTSISNVSYTLSVSYPEPQPAAPRMGGARTPLPQSERTLLAPTTPRERGLGLLRQQPGLRRVQ